MDEEKVCSKYSTTEFLSSSKLKKNLNKQRKTVLSKGIFCMVHDVAIVFLNNPSKLKTLKADVFLYIIREDI